MAQLLLPSSAANVIELLSGSDFAGSYEGWRYARAPILAYIQKESQVLDITCANGVLLASLLEWHEDVFWPVGFDYSFARVRDARTLFPMFADRFHVQNFWWSPWPVKPVDTVIAPWIANHDFIDTCKRHARRNVIFTAYNDLLEKGIDLRVECQVLGYRDAEIFVRPHTVQLAIMWQGGSRGG